MRLGARKTAKSTTVDLTDQLTQYKLALEEQQSVVDRQAVVISDLQEQLQDKRDTSTLVVLLEQLQKDLEATESASATILAAKINDLRTDLAIKDKTIEVLREEVRIYKGTLSSIGILDAGPDTISTKPKEPAKRRGFLSGGKDKE